MGSVVMQAVCSVDGFIADENDRVGPMFEWYDNGDVEQSLFEGVMRVRLSKASADHVEKDWARAKVTVIGRHLFDITNGWSGRPPTGNHVIVISHRRRPEDWDFPNAPFTFVTGVEEGIRRAREFAGDGLVSLCAGDVGGQAFAAGLVDEVEMDVVPTVFGSGKRFFGSFAGTEISLDDPVVVPGKRVTHLRYRVRR